MRSRQCDASRIAALLVTRNMGDSTFGGMTLITLVPVEDV